MVRVIAIPGSGKTAVTVARLLELLEEGTRPQEICALTFTKEAAAEMNKRAGFEADGSYKICRTFHGFALDFVQKESKAFPFPLESFPLLKPAQGGKLIAHAMRGFDEVDFKPLATFISLCKRGNISPTKAMLSAESNKAMQLAKAYGKYESKCRELGLMDFDSLMMETVKLLDTRPDVSARWQFKYLMNDEAQDNDEVQWRLGQLLTKKHGNYFVVGDPNQSMYAFRGAKPNGLTEDFAHLFPGATTIILPQNYRSTPEVVDYCKKIARLPADGFRTSNPSGSPVIFARFPFDTKEAEYVINKVREPKHTAILSRTNGGLAAFEEQCMIANMKYQLLGKCGFWGQEEVKNVLAYLQFAISPTDNCVKRIIRTPYAFTRFLKKQDTIDALKAAQDRSLDSSSGKRSLGAALMGLAVEDNAQSEYLRQLKGFLQRLKQRVPKMNAADAVQFVLEEADVIGYYDTEEHSTPDNNPVENLNKLGRHASRYGTLYEFMQYVRKCVSASRSASGLTLSTVHQAKGKEWDDVFVVNVNDEVMPHKRGEPAEEQNIYFVACSRAAKRLHISCSGIPSRYIAADVPEEESEIDPVFLEDFQLTGE